MNIKEAILNGTICKDCIYYEYCYYDRDCIAMYLLKKVAKIHDNNLLSNDTNKGDQ